jgi:N-acetylmuramoyl-L-alanine amidase
MYLDGVHYVMSFPVENGDHGDWLVSRMDVIKLFEPILRPTEIAGRHTIRGVVIDAGHGGTDNGATSRLGAEKNYTLDTAFRLRKILQDAGFKVVFTRSNDVFVDLYERAHIASLYPDYAFVSIHFNSATPEARGLETYCLSPRGAASTSSNYLTRGDIQKLPGNDYDTQNILLASMVHSEIIKLNPGDQSADRGVKRARFVVIKQNVLPAILVEGGFVSNHMESSRVDRPDYRQSLANAIARGVIRFSNSMGDRNTPLPGGGSIGSDDDQPKPAPKAVPVAPPAPSGLAHDSPNIKSATATTAPTSAGTTTTAKTKKKKKTAAGTPAPAATPSTTPAAAPDTTSPAPAPAGTTTPPATTTPSPAPAASSTPSGSLNLAEPATPTPAPGMDKSSAEPDEPPTVNIYPTTSGTTDKSAAPKSSAPASGSTNAAPEGAQP